MSKDNNFFLARYNKKDCLLGVYETYHEAVLKVYGYDRNHPKYHSAYGAICGSANKIKRANGNRRAAKGFWYKIQK